MMNRAKKTVRSTVAALAFILLTLPLGGCDVVGLDIAITDWHSKTVEGVRFYRVNNKGRWKPVLDVEFTDIGSQRGIEFVTTIYDDGEGEPIEWPAIVTRTGDGDGLVVHLPALPLDRRGEYRISAFNSDGESALSRKSLHI